MDKLYDKKYYPWLLVAVFSLTGITIPATVTQFSMTVPDLACKFGVSQQFVLMGDTVRSIFVVFGMFLSGMICSRFGLKKSIALGLSLQVLPQVIIPFSPNIYGFLFLKALQGLNSIAFPLYISTILMWMNQEKKGLATAIFNGSFSAGAGVGATLAGYIIPRYGWQTSYFTIGFICAAFSAILIVVTKEKEYDTSKTSTLTKETARGLDLYRQVVRMPSTWLMIITIAGCTWVMTAVTVDMPIYLSHLSYSLESTGLLMMTISAVTVVASLFGGAVSDHFASKSRTPLSARYAVLVFGYIVSGLFAVILPLVASKSMMLLAVAATMMVFGSSWVQGVFWAIPSEIYPNELLVVGTGFCSGASNMTYPIAPVVVGVVLGLQGMWTAGWISCAMIIIISVFACIRLSLLNNSSKSVKNANGCF